MSEEPVSFLTPHALHKQMREAALWWEGMPAPACRLCGCNPIDASSLIHERQAELDEQGRCDEVDALMEAYDEQTLHEARYALLCTVNKLEELYHSRDQNAYAVAIQLLVELRELAFGEPKRRPLDKHVRTMVFRRDGYQCVECGEHEVHELSVDHIIPVALGGINNPDNLRTLCRRCNSSKGKRI